MDEMEKLITHINNCLLPKLSRNNDEIGKHPEYNDRQNALDNHFPHVLRILANSNETLSSEVLASLIILYLQRSYPTVWNTPKCKCYIQQLHQVFILKHGVSIECILHSDSFCNTQNVFDIIMVELNSNLVSDDLKKYPGLIDVYVALTTDLEKYKIKINPTKIFPISLQLLDDYQTLSKIRGLQCISSIIKCLTEKHFKSGNYYEVLFSSLKKAMSIKDVKITTLVLQALLDLIKIVPSDVKKKAMDEIFAKMLEQLHLEPNLYRKSKIVKFLKVAIQVHKVNCVNKRLLKVVLLETIYICCNDAVADILLVDLLECLQEWISHCWCVWQLSTDHKMLSALIKVMYISRKEFIAGLIQDFIMLLISLCTKEEQIKIYKNLEKSDIKSPEFNEKMEEIKSDILKFCG